MRYRIGERGLFLYCVSSGMVICLCSCVSAFGQTLHIPEHDYRGALVTAANIWAVLELHDPSGAPITQLTLDDVAVHESIVEAATGTQTTAPNEIDLAAQAVDPWKEAGLWEMSVGAVKLDIAFMVDGTGSMGSAMSSIRSEVHEFIDALIFHHVDFRISAVAFAEVPVHLDPSPFYGPLEIEKLRDEIDRTFYAAGDWWSPTVAYDAVLNVLWNGFREDAHRLVVVITDIVPQTVYGTFWYAGGCTAATLSGVEFFLNDHDIYVFFSHDADTSTDADYDLYCDLDINPRAGIEDSGFEALAERVNRMGRPLATNIGWPFESENLQAAIRSHVNVPSLFRSPIPIVQSCYYLSWVTDMVWYEDIEALPGNPEDVLYRADIGITLPGTQTALSTYCTFPTRKLRAPVTIHVCDEHGRPHDDSWSYLKPLMGDRPMPLFYQLAPTNGQIFLEHVPVGRYLLSVTDGGHPYSYSSLRGRSDLQVNISTGTNTIDAVMTSIDKDADLARTRGLLKDLADWRSPGDPFQDFADDANAWLDALSADGVTWDELVQIKRFEMALSGYAAITEYAHLQTEGAIRDFHEILMDFIAIIQETEGLHKSVQNDWLDATVEILATIVDILITHGEFTVNRELLEAALNELISYAQNELITDLKALVVQQIPAGPYKPLITAMMYTCLDAEFEDWAPVMDAARELALHLAKQEAGELLADNIVLSLFEDVELNTPLELAIEGFVHNIIETLVSEDGFDNLDVSLHHFGQSIGQHVLVEGSDRRTEVLDAVESIFDKVEESLPPGTFRDFLVGMARDFALQAVPTVENGTLKYAIDSEAVIKILVRHALYNVVLKDYYASDVAAGLYQTLYRAQAYLPENRDRYSYEAAMYSDFRDFRLNMVGPLQDTAWNALSSQRDVNNWANALETLGSVLESLSIPLEFFATFYVPLQDTAEAVASFAAVLDGMQIVTRAIEFGLKLDCLNILASRAEPFYETIFPAPAESVYLMGVTPLVHDFGVTKATWNGAVCPVTIWNAGNEPLSISDIKLGDTANFSFAAITGTLTPTIAPRHSHTIYVRFQPTSTGIFETALTVDCAMTDPAQRSITLRGIGTYLDTGIRGDTNSDGHLNAIDVQLVINAVLGIFNYAHTDLNNDGRLNALDIQLVINAVLGLPINI